MEGATPLIEAARTIGPIVIGNRFGGGSGNAGQAPNRTGNAIDPEPTLVCLVHHQAVYNQNEFWDRAGEPNSPLNY